MGDLKLFLKGNKKQRENVMYAATESIKDENGKAVEWELRAITSKEDERIRDECTTEVQVTGKPGMMRPKFNNGKYMEKLAVACVVYPNLNDAELQDSYGVMKPEELLHALIDLPGEYNALLAKVQEINGFTSMKEKIETAKN